jgi:hypothetical protein
LPDNESGEKIRQNFNQVRQKFNQENGISQTNLNEDDINTQTGESKIKSIDEKMSQIL